MRGTSVVVVWACDPQPSLMHLPHDMRVRIFNMGSMQLATNESQQIEIPELLYFI
jgi:hypothetical protein